MVTSFDYAAVASALHDPAALARTTAAYGPGFERIGGAPAAADGAAGARPLVAFVLTGGTEGLLLERWRARQATAPWEPLVLVAHPNQNSLPAALEALARLQAEGARGRIVQLTGPEDDRGWAELAALVAGLHARRALAATRLGAVGAPSEWLVASMPAAEVVARRWGPLVVPVDVDALVTRTREAEVPVSVVRSLTDRAVALREPNEATVASAARALPALEALVDRYRLDAVTVRCFDLVTDVATSGCVALADLNDAGVVAGCEGDVVSAVGMLWVRLLLDTPSWMANPARVDVAANRMLLAHCTIARSLVDRYELRSHFESGLGVGIAGDLAASEVTLVRIGGVDMERLWLAEGAVVDRPHEEGLCRTQLEVALDVGDVSDILRHPLGNHVVVVPGRHAARLRAWWELFVADPALS